jgi:hypothetical protein
MTKYHQIFVTQCRVSDSVLGQPGFSIRATSLKPDDPLLTLAMNLSPYDLPMLAYDGARPYPWEAPIRLAAIPLKETGLVAIMHSVYIQTNYHGSQNSYFTHVIFVPKEEFSWRTTLKSWGAIQWQIPDVTNNSDEIFNPPRWITQWPNHATNELPMLDSLPESGLKEHHFIDELYAYYQKSPMALEIVLGGVLARLKKKDEPKNGVKNIKAYLLPRNKIYFNQSEGHYPGAETDEENNSFWPKNSQFRFGKNIRETLQHLSFIAWFFPESLLTDQGFSTYEPHNYGVSIAEDKLLVGIVHAKGESPDEMMIGHGIEYYSTEKEGSLAIDQSDELFQWGKQQINQIFKEKTLMNFSKEINEVFESFMSSGWDCYQKSKELFDTIKDYEKKTSFITAYKLLTCAKTNDYALGKFIEQQERALPEFIYAGFKFHSENKEKEFLNILTLLADTRFFDWSTVCTHLTTDNFWQLSKKDYKFAAKFCFFKSILKRSISDRYKDQLKNSLNNFFFTNSCFQIWKTDEKWIWELFNFYCKIDKKETAKYILSIVSYETAITSILQQWKKNANNNLVEWPLVLPWLLELSICNKTVSCFFEALYKDLEFVLMLAEIVTDKTKITCNNFFELYQKDDLKILALTKGNEKEASLPSLLMKFLLNNEKILSEEAVSVILFSGNMPIIVKIIKAEKKLPNWLLEKIEIFLEKIDPECFFPITQPLKTKKTEEDYQFFPFDELIDELNEATIVSAQKYSFLKLLDILKGLAAIKKYAANVPDLFEIDEFELNVINLKNWGGKVNQRFRNVVIEHLATKIKEFENEEGGYDKAHGKFILLLLSLNHLTPHECFAYLNYRGTFLYDVHFRFMPEILLEKDGESKSNLVYSMLKNNWIQKFSATKLLDSEFLKVKRKVGNRFRLEYIPIAKVYAFLGSFLKGKLYEQYDYGRKVGQVLFFMVFFIQPLWHLIFARENLVNTGYLNGVELLNCISFGLVASVWGCSDFFSKANNLCKPENYSKNKYIDWNMIGVAIWSIFGAGLSVFFYLSPTIGCTFGAIVLIEAIWFAVYIVFIYKDPIYVFLSPNIKVLDLNKE